MGIVYGRLTVYFEEPFWVGVFERAEDGRLTAAKVTFGAEPRELEIYDLILHGYGSLKFSPAVSADVKEPKRNPKKARREIKRALERTGSGTKSQQALSLQWEQNKLERRTESRERRQAEAERRFRMKQQKKKEKHRGR